MHYLPESSQSLLEFVLIKLVVTIEVHSLEDDFEGAKSNASLLLDSKLESEV